MTLPVVKDFGVGVLNDQLLIVGGRNIYCEETNEMFAFNLKEIDSSNKFENHTSLKPMNTKRFGHSVAVLDGYLYAVGGHDSFEFLDTAERLQLQLHSFSSFKKFEYLIFPDGIQFQIPGVISLLCWLIA